MPAIAQTYISLADVYRRQDANNKFTPIIELLAAMNPILDDAMAVECNQGATHLTTVRTGMPVATWRKLYQGVQPTKSTTAQVIDTTGMLEAWSEVDAKLVKLSGSPAELRLSEATAFIEGMSQQAASAIFYEDTATTPERMLGLRPRFNDSTAAGTGTQIVKAGGVGADNASIWFVVWGESTVHLLYPKMSKAGLSRNDIGEETRMNTDGSLYRVMREQFTWDIGLSLRDYRYVTRVANIDVSDALAGTVDVIPFMIQAYYKLWQRRIANGKLAIYCNRDIKTALHLKARSTVTNSTLAIEKIEGKEIVTFMGAPIREVDALLSNESPCP
jgi:hypothetical protein